MFEAEAAIDVAHLDPKAALAVAGRCRATVDRAEADLLAVAAHYADLHPAPAPAPGGGRSFEVLPGMERTVVLGGEGCPSVAEFAAIEFGAAIGESSGAAASLIEDALALRHRLPRVWSRVQAGEVQAWRARRIAQASGALSRAAAGLVDARVARIAQSVTPYRLTQIVQAAVMDADPDHARAAADTAADTTADTTTDATADPTADDTAADVASAGGAKKRRASGLGDAVTFYVHLTDQTLATGTGIVRASATTTATTCRTTRTRTRAESTSGTDGEVRRSEQLRPMLAAQLAELIGQPGARIVIKPVIDLNQQIAVDAYEIPDVIREHVLLRYATCMFPYCNRPATPGATGIDLDHVVPFDDTGPPGQTSTENLAPGCRLHHRVKTHGGWRCRRLPDGAFEWTSPLGRRYRVDHTGTHPLN